MFDKGKNSKSAKEGKTPRNLSREGKGDRRKNDAVKGPLLNQKSISKTTRRRMEIFRAKKRKKKKTSRAKFPSGAAGRRAVGRQNKPERGLLRRRRLSLRRSRVNSREKSLLRTGAGSDRRGFVRKGVVE